MRADRPRKWSRWGWWMDFMPGAPCGHTAIRAQSVRMQCALAVANYAVLCSDATQIGMRVAAPATMACMLLTRRAGVALPGAGAAAYGAFSQDEIESIARYWRPDGKYGCICSASDVNPHTTMFTASGALACDVTPFNWILRDISTTKSGGSPCRG